MEFWEKRILYLWLCLSVRGVENNMSLQAFPRCKIVKLTTFIMYGPDGYTVTSPWLFDLEEYVFLSIILIIIIIWATIPWFFRKNPTCWYYIFVQSKNLEMTNCPCLPDYSVLVPYLKAYYWRLSLPTIPDSIVLVPYFILLYSVYILCRMAYVSFNFVSM